MQPLGDVAGGRFRSSAQSVSADGRIIVGRAEGPTFPKAFIWEEGKGLRTIKHVLEEHGIDMAGWILEIASGISAGGQTMVGTGTNPSSRQTEAWVAVIPREPSWSENGPPSSRGNRGIR